MFDELPMPFWSSSLQEGNALGRYTDDELVVHTGAHIGTITGVRMGNLLVELEVSNDGAWVAGEGALVVAIVVMYVYTN